MDIKEVLEHLDTLFDKQALQEIEPYLTEQLERAYSSQDYHACMTILNEMIGFFRDTSQYQKALDRSEQVLMLIQQLGYEGTLAHATTMLNVANALRAAGLHQESLAFYKRIFPIYEKQLDPYDERVASLYNNLSLLYQEMDDHASAVVCLMKALDIISRGKDQIKIAVTHSNLGSSLLQLGEVEQAMYHLNQAMLIFGKSKEKDFHYSAAAAAMGQAYMLIDDLPKARACYLDALYEQQKHCGKSEAFYRILNNLHIVEQKLGVALTPEPSEQGVRKQHIKGLELSEEFYEKVAKQSLFEQFSDIIDSIAVGLVGEGSECFGLDDELSEDHDFGPGFCIWLPKQIYDVFGTKLQSWYDSLPTEYKGFQRMPATLIGTKRTGVWCIDDFFLHFVGHKDAKDISEQDILQISDDGMAAILNGRVFYDPSGVFSKKRLEFYEAFSERVWNTKIAYSLILLGKYGQYNYPRCMKRGDYVTAQMVLYKYIEELLKFVHYYNHVFPPYYKWLKKSASGLSKLAVLADLTDALADFADAREAWKEDANGSEDKVAGTIEIVAKLIVDEAKESGLFTNVALAKEELFLEAYGKALLMNMSETKKEAQVKEERPLTVLSDSSCLENNSKEELVDYVVSMEWQAFDAVQNQGGRADCQDNWGTFSIMRKSQYLAWEKPLIISFIEDFQQAKARNWNLITEKYARMMKTTDPKGYAKLADTLPELSQMQERIIEQIVSMQVTWMEQFALEYPNMAYNSRSIHTSEDTLYNTSYETYLRGELSTYSAKTLQMYGRFIVKLSQNEQNLAKLIMSNTAILYGYASLEDAEKRLAESNY